jgi:hypothetical protein
MLLLLLMLGCEKPMKRMLCGRFSFVPYIDDMSSGYNVLFKNSTELECKEWHTYEELEKAYSLSESSCTLGSEEDFYSKNDITTFYPTGTYSFHENKYSLDAPTQHMITGCFIAK